MPVESRPALGLEWSEFRCLIPGGVPPDELPGEVLEPLSLLILSPADLKNMSPEIWMDRFLPQAILATGGSFVDLPGWIELDRYTWVSFQTNGTRLWIEGQKR